MNLAMYRVFSNGRVIYYPVRKAASTSLQSAFGGQPVDMRQVPTQGVLSFTVVRNPFGRLASLYANNLDYYPFTKHGIFKGMSFEDFIAKVYETREPYCDQHLWGANHTTPKHAEVYYFEDLINEVTRLNAEFDLNLILRHFGETKGKKPEWTDDTLGMVRERYQKDLERFYEDNSYPESCRISGKATAQVRQARTRRVDELYSQLSRTTPTDSTPK